MDLESQVALRHLKRSFDAKEQRTPELLLALGIEKVYIVSGIFTGFFFSLDELKAGIDCYNIYYSPDERKSLNTWFSETKDSPLMLAMSHTRDWFSWNSEFDGPYLRIEIFDLRSRGLFCCDNPVNTKLSSYLTAEECPSCKIEVCVFHFICCRACQADGCIACFFLNEKDPDLDFLCQTCAEKAGLFAKTEV